VPIIRQHVKQPKKLVIVDAAEFPKNLVLASHNLRPAVRLFNCLKTELSCHAVLDSKVVLLTPSAVDHIVSMVK
jgi:hypothetical protein